VKAIEVENLSKLYYLGGKKSNSIREAFLNLGRREATQELWALRSVNFDLDQGDTLGIIGRNGAGKSTLLKILSRITKPTSGSANISGRVANLLEVGTGFHAELTGRENIFLNAAIMGMSREQIAKKFDEIIDFAEVEKFLDTPVKHYSSGMYMRLAFAVAAHLEPDVLIVDEVLAVGDAEFQRKCLGKMQTAAENGRTVLFVSHDMSAISTLTKKAVFLDKGEVKFFGDTGSAIQEYIKSRKQQDFIYLSERKPDIPSISRVEIFTSEANNVHAFGKPMEIEFEVNLPSDSEGMGIAFQIMNQFSKPIVASWNYQGSNLGFGKKGLHRIRCQIPNLRLYQGDYAFTVGLANEKGPEIFEHIVGICPFEVEMYGVKAEHPLGWIRDVCAYVEDCEWSSIRDK
jgi:lipopolysaccharide transport system ATP-binding protein